MRRQNFSKKREAILQSICSTAIHPTAEWVYNDLKPRYPDLSLGTVYRNIALFKEQGVVASVGTVGGQERIDGNTKPHAHFICTDCGAVLDIHEMEDNKLLDYSVMDTYGLKVEYHNLCFYAKCTACQKKDEEKHA